MAPEWFYEKDDECFVVYDDAKGSCWKRRFIARDGTFLDETPGQGKSFADHFKRDIKSANRLGEVRKRPNLVDAVRAGQLPSDVLSELKGLVRVIHGIQV
jgi:hypothetical protein